jgi:putative membrane protein
MLTHLFSAVIGNALALYIAGYVVDGFNLTLMSKDQLLNPSAWIPFLSLVAVFAFLSLVIKPLLRLFLGPIIILTLGLFNLVITAGILFVVDKYAENLTISTLPALAYGTIIITIVNIVIHSLLKKSGD